MAATSSLQLPNICLQRFKSGRFTKDVRTKAHQIREALVKGHQIPLMFKENSPEAQSSAYEVSAASCALSMQNGMFPIGRKIGFTNTKIWDKYNVSEPNWGYLWDKRTFDIPDVRGVMWMSDRIWNVQPKIEPEIIFCLKKTPKSDMTEPEVLSCIEWMAGGFESVVSVFKDWEFNLANTTATNALHDRLFIGEKRYIEEKDVDVLPAQLANFELNLLWNDTLVDTGCGSNVLGSPIKALIRLCTILENQDLHPQLTPGEIITTGTLTKAITMSNRETWSTEIIGIDLNSPSLKIRPLPPRLSKLRVIEKGSFKRLAFGREPNSSIAEGS